MFFSGVLEGVALRKRFSSSGLLDAGIVKGNASYKSIDAFLFLAPPNEAPIASVAIPWCAARPSTLLLQSTQNTFARRWATAMLGRHAREEQFAGVVRLAPRADLPCLARDHEAV